MAIALLNPPLTGVTTSDRSLIGTDGRGTVGNNSQLTVWGSVIPISEGFRRIIGVPIWGGPLVKANFRTIHEPVPASGPLLLGNPMTSTVWDLQRSFAIALGKRLNPGDPPPEVRRVWVDGQIAYENGNGAPIEFNNITDIYVQTGTFINGAYAPQSTIPAGVQGSGGLVGASGAVPVRVPIKSNLTFRFYDGNEAQTPDGSISDALGDLAPAYRGLMYMVFDGLVVGTGGTFDDGHGNNAEAQSTGPDVFPVVSVELVDSATHSLAENNFRMLDDATEFRFNSVVPMVNWDTRTIAAFNYGGTNPGDTSILEFFDMDTATQLSQFQMAVDADGAVGSTDNFSVWDTINRVFYTLQDNHMLVSVDEQGNILDQGMEPGFNNGAFDEDGNNPLTTGKPATVFAQLRYGAVDYVLDIGELNAVVGAATFVFLFNTFVGDSSGVLPTEIQPEQFYETPGQVTSVDAFNLYKRAIDDRRTQQDAVFLVSTSYFPSGGSGAPAVELVYVTQRDGISRVLGRTRVFDAVDPQSSVHAFVDGDGHITIQESGAHQLISRLRVEYSDNPDFVEAPGFRGLFPRVTGTMYSNVEPPFSVIQWDHNTVYYSDKSAGTFCPDGHGMLNVGDGTYTALTGSTVSNFSNVWDSVTQALFWHANIGSSDLPDQPFTGRGMKYQQVWGGLNGDIGTLGAVLRDISHAAGYEDADLDIDAGLTDQVPGVLILKTYSLAQLFNDIGVMYDFTYFNSGGSLKFTRSTNSPDRATGGWSITGAVADGGTATIGTVVYRFKTTPSQPFDVKIGVNTSADVVDFKEKTAANFLAAIMGDLTLAAEDAQDPDDAPGFFAGTVANPAAYAQSTGDTNFGFTQLTLFAQVAGVAGNSVATTDTSSGFGFTHATLTGGADVPVPDINLTQADLAHVSENQLTPDDGLITIIAPEGRGQQAASVTYFALEQSYTLSTQVYTPDSQDGNLLAVGGTTVNYDLPFVISTTEAYARVVKTAIKAADNVVVQNFRLGQAFLLLEPSDVITVTIAPFAYTIRLDECTFNGDFSTSYSAVNYLFRSDVPINSSDSTSDIPQTVALGSDGIPVVIDAPVLDPAQGTTAGNVNLRDGIRAYRTGFQQAQLNFSLNSVGQMLFTTSHDVKWGTLASVLPAAVEPLYRTVEDSIDIVCKTIAAADLASGTYQDLVQGRNCIAVGIGNNWEFIYFRDVEFIGGKTFRLTGLVRGQRGTDYAIAGHGASDIVVLVASVATSFDTGTFREQSIDADVVGEELTYSVLGLPASRATVQVSQVLKGYELFPFSPCLLAAAPGTSSSVDLSWVRRDRLNTEYVTNPTVLSEVDEKYDLEIMSGSSVVRTVVDLTSPAYNYSSADQTTDGFTPPLASIKFRVYQKGELGRGFPREETVNVE